MTTFIRIEDRIIARGYVVDMHRSYEDDCQRTIGRGFQLRYWLPVITLGVERREVCTALYQFFVLVRA